MQYNGTIYLLEKNAGSFFLRGTLPEGMMVSGSRLHAITIVGDWKGIPTTEFKSVQEAAKALKDIGYEVTVEHL